MSHWQEMLTEDWHWNTAFAEKMPLGKNASYIFWDPEKMPPEMNFFSKCSSKFCVSEKMPPRKIFFQRLSYLFQYKVYFNTRYQINIKFLQDKQLYINVIKNTNWSDYSHKLPYRVLIWKSHNVVLVINYNFIHQHTSRDILF